MDTVDEVVARADRGADMKALVRSVQTGSPLERHFGARF